MFSVRKSVSLSLTFPLGPFFFWGWKETVSPLSPPPFFVFDSSERETHIQSTGERRTRCVFPDLSLSLVFPLVLFFRRDEKAKLVPWGERTFKEAPPRDMNAKVGESDGRLLGRGSDQLCVRGGGSQGDILGHGLQYFADCLTNLRLLLLDPS